MGKNKINEKRATFTLLVSTKDKAYAAGKIRANKKACPLDAERIKAEPRPMEIKLPKIRAGSMGEPTKYTENAISMIANIAPESLFVEKKKQMPQSRHTAMDMPEASLSSPLKTAGSTKEEASMIRNAQVTGKIGNLSGEAKRLPLVEAFSL